MTLEDLGNIGEFVGAIAVVMSLLYLAIQIRQNTKTVRTSTYQSVLESSHRVNEYLADPQRERLYRMGRFKTFHRMICQPGLRAVWEERGRDHFSRSFGERVDALLAAPPEDEREA